MTGNTAPSRDTAFDAVKGVLVVLMVVYHALSIASTAGAEAFRYIRFISGSFIFISGFVISRFMSARFAAAPGATTRRLVTRGAKVLLIFTALNLAIHASGFGNAAKRHLGIEGFVSNAASIYLVGDGTMSSFLILLPIAYLMVIAPLYLAIVGRAGTPAAIVLLVAALAAGSGALGPPAPIAEFMLVGLCGLCLGTPALTDALIGRPPPGRLLTLVGLFAAVWLTGRFGDPLALYCVGVAVVLKFLHDAVRLLSPGGRTARWAELLGVYALPCYIAQIVVLQIGFRLMGGTRQPPGLGIVVFMVATTAICLALAVVTQRLRRRSALVDRTYRWVFA